jgi:ectoine hydroxylase-related dioxygenase (phytanoyl-CoA dioxygenase family)
MPIITDSQRAALDEDGYFILENVFTAEEMDELAGRIEAHQRRHEEAIAAKGGTQGISRANEITFTSHLAQNDEAIRAFVLRPEFVAITTEILGPDVDLYWNQSVFKSPEGQKQFPWHQDDGYTPVTPSPYLTLWLALNDATPENGCISVMPGSYKRGLLPHKQSDIGLVCHDAEDPDQGVLVPVKAGSLAVFWSLTMHKSGANLSSGPRKAFVIQYAHAGVKNAVTGEQIPDLIPLARNGVPA